MHRPIIAILSIALLGATPTASGAVQVDIQPHRAFYTLKLASAETGSGVVGADGVMSFEWAQSCDGWTIQQRAVFDVFGAEGNAVRTEVTLSSWEDKEGKNFRFTGRTTQNGSVVEELRGDANLGPDGQGGTANYVKPKPQEVALPADTVFAAAHTILILQEALAGKTVVMRPVFLGQREEEPMTVNALISAKHQDEPEKPEWRELLGGPFWNTHLAFFEPGNDAAVPTFEVRERLYANGIVGNATVQYDTFAFRYALEKLEKLPTPKC